MIGRSFRAWDRFNVRGQNRLVNRLIEGSLAKSIRCAASPRGSSAYRPNLATFDADMTCSCRGLPILPVALLISRARKHASMGHRPKVQLPRGASCVQSCPSRIGFFPMASPLAHCTRYGLVR
jgi:hypothetical protein